MCWEESALTGAMEERDRMSINGGPVWLPMECYMLHRSHVQAATRTLCTIVSPSIARNFQRQLQGSEPWGLRCRCSMGHIRAEVALPVICFHHLHVPAAAGVQT